MKDHFGGKTVGKSLQLKRENNKRFGIFLAKYGAVSILFLGFKMKYL